MTMRSRSRTSTSMSPTRTRTRGMSISFTPQPKLVLNLRSPKPSLENLPSELLFTVIQYASFPSTVEDKLISPLPIHVKRRELTGVNSNVNKHKGGLDYQTLCSLSLTSRSISVHALSLLYRAVTISSTPTAELFTRTVSSKKLMLAPLPNPGYLVTRLVLSPSDDYDAHTFSSTSFMSRSPGSFPLRMQMLNVDFYASAVKLLGMEGYANVSPTFPIPVLSSSEMPVKLATFNPPCLDSLRTLVVDTIVLQRYIGCSTELASANTTMTSSPLSEDIPLSSSSPFLALNELILSTLLPSNSYLSLMAPSPSPLSISSSPVSNIFPRLTHLTVTSHLGSRSSLKSTISLLGGIPNLSHVALIRRANANEDNDSELIMDIRELMNDERRRGILKQVVIGVVPDNDFAYWYEDRMGRIGTERRKEEILEEYLSTSHIWTELNKLSMEMTPGIGTFMEASAQPPLLSIVPAREDAWACALKHGSDPTSSIFESNVFGTFDETGGPRGVEKDLWLWAKNFEVNRRRRQQSVAFHS